MTLNVQETAKAVAAALGAGWSYAPVPHGGPFFFAHLHGPQGLVLLLSSTSLDKGRFRIGADWPRSKYDHGSRFPRAYQLTLPDEITVAGTKTPEQIAKDIVRRVLPEVTALFQQGLKQREDHDKWEEDTDRLTEELRAIVKDKPSTHSYKRQFSASDPEVGRRGYIEAQVNGPDSVKLMLSLTAAEAREILRQLADKWGIRS